MASHRVEPGWEPPPLSPPVMCSSTRRFASLPSRVARGRSSGAPKFICTPRPSTRPDGSLTPNVSGLANSMRYLAYVHSCTRVEPSCRPRPVKSPMPASAAKVGKMAEPRVIGPVVHFAAADEDVWVDEDLSMMSAGKNFLMTSTVSASSRRVPSVPLISK